MFIKPLFLTSIIKLQQKMVKKELLELESLTFKGFNPNSLNDLIKIFGGDVCSIKQILLSKNSEASRLILKTGSRKRLIERSLNMFNINVNKYVYKCITRP